MLEQRAAAAIEPADRCESRDGNAQFAAKMLQHRLRNHLDRVERQARQPQIADLQRDTQAVHRAPVPPNCAAV